MNSSLKVGCGGFSVSRQRYFCALSTVEVGAAFIQPPRLATAEQWKKEAPRGFDFSLPASQVVTHPADSPGYAKILSRIPERRRAFCGHFKDTPEVALAWEQTRSLAKTLAAKFVVFETPVSFYADANHLRDMYRFFKALRREGPLLVWHPRAVWEPKLLSKVCADLGLVRASDPLGEPGGAGEGLRYIRLRRAQYLPAELKELRRASAEGPCYVYFTHRYGWAQARQFLELDYVRHLRRL